MADVLVGSGASFSSGGDHAPGLKGRVRPLREQSRIDPGPIAGKPTNRPTRRSAHGRIPVMAWATSDAASAPTETVFGEVTIGPVQRRSRCVRCGMRSIITAIRVAATIAANAF